MPKYHLTFEFEFREPAMGAKGIEAAKYSLKGFLALLKVYSLIGIFFTRDPLQILICSLLLIALYMIDKNPSTKWHG